MMFTQEPCYHTLEFWEKKFIYIYISIKQALVYMYKVELVAPIL